jgi:hypothetical protein
VLTNSTTGRRGRTPPASWSFEALQVTETKNPIRLESRFMAKNKKSKPSRSNGRAAKPVAAIVARSAVRNSPIPRPTNNTNSTASPRREIAPEHIAKRAYEIYLAGRGGSQLDHWLQAERELKTATR